MGNSEESDKLTTTQEEIQKLDDIRQVIEDVENGLSPSSFDKSCSTPSCKECMAVCNIKLPFNNTNCQSNCNNSSSCKSGCVFYNHIAENNKEKLELHDQSLPDINSSFEVILDQNHDGNLMFQWPVIFSKSSFIQSIYLITITVVNKANSTESVLDLVSKNIFSLKKDLVCNSLDKIISEFQLNVYPVNYNGYSESLKISSIITNCADILGCDENICVYSNITTQDCENILSYDEDICVNPNSTSKCAYVSSYEANFCVYSNITITSNLTNNSKKIILTHGSFLGDLNIILKEYTVSLNEKSEKCNQSLKSVFHLTLGSEFGVYGDNNQGIWTYNDNSIVTFTTDNLNVSSIKANNPYMFGQWYFIRVRLSLQDGSLSDLQIINGKAEYLVGNIPTSLLNNYVIAEIPMLEKEYFISFDVYPYDFGFEELNILYFLANFNSYIVGIWFHEDGSGRLKIYTPIIDDQGFISFITNPIGINVWSNIEVCQIMKDTSYIFTIKINGELVFSKINNQTQSFDNVYVYASVKWLNIYDCLIKNLFIINGISNSSLQPLIVQPKDYVDNRKEFRLVQGLFLGTLRVLKKIFSVSFKVKPTKFIKGIKNVLHLTLGKNFELYSYRSLGVWYHEDGSGKLVIVVSINGNANYYIETPPLRLGEWSFVKVCQDFQESKYWLSVDLNGLNIHKVENSDPRNFKNVKVYASDLWYDAQHGTIAKLLIVNGSPEYIVSNSPTSLVKGKFVAVLPKLEKEYLVSFDLILNKFAPGFHGVLYFSLDSGYGVLGVWHYQEGAFLIVTPLNGFFDLSFVGSKYFITKQYELSIWISIGIVQVLKGMNYVYTIRINGEQVFSDINNHAQSAENVKVYVSDPYDEAQDGSIRNFFISNSISNGSIVPIIVLPTDFINQKEEFNLTQGSLIGTLNILRKVYTVSFNVKPRNYTKGMKNVLHLTLGNNFGAYGDRNPGVWFHEDGSGKLVIFAAVSGNVSYYIETPPLPLNQWTFVKIFQSFMDSKYWFSVDINGINIHRVENSDARNFTNIKVYASDIWYDCQDGSISDLLVINGNAEYLIGKPLTQLVKGKIIVEIPTLDKEYIVSLDIYPNNFISGWHNIISFIVGDYTCRVPGIWSHLDGDGKLQIAAPVNNNLFQYVNTKPIKIKFWSNIVVSQVFKNNAYIYSIMINGEVIYSEINNQTQSFDKVKVFASDPAFEAQDCYIKNLFVINGILNNGMQPILVSDYIYNREEFSPMQGLLLNTLNVLMKVYTVSFKIKPTNYTKGLKNILHLTLGNDFGRYGDRNPGVWFHEDGSGKLVIFAAVSGNASYYVETPPLKLNQWSSVKIHQSLIKNKYWFFVNLNGVYIHRVENSDARDFKNMKVYASDYWYDAQNGSITDLLIINGKTEYFVESTPSSLVKEKIIAQIPKLDKEYFFSIDICPNNFEFVWQNVISFAIGTDNLNKKYWYRIHYIFFHKDGDGKLQIGIPTNGKLNWVYNTRPVKLHVCSNVIVSQMFNGSVYMFRINVNGEVIFSEINNQSQSFSNVTVFASDPAFDAANCLIKNFFLINGISKSEMRPIALLPADYIDSKKELNLNSSSLLGTLNVLMKVYTIFFYVKPITYTKGLKYVLSLTLEKDFDDLNQGIWFHENGSGKLVIFSAISGNTTYYIETAPLTLGEWSSVKICQSFSKSKYWWSVDLNGFNIYKVENSDAKDFNNMKVYASDHLPDAQNGFIKNILIINGKMESLVDQNPISLVKGRFIAEIPQLDKEFFISFDVNPTKFVAGRHSIVHFLIGSDSYAFSIWFHEDGDGKLLIYTPFMNYKGYMGYITNSIGLNLWSNIKICQFLQGAVYEYKISINEQVVYSNINNQSQSFNNVKVYASNPWSEAQDGMIKNLIVINGILNSSLEPIVVLPADFISQRKELILNRGVFLGTVIVLMKGYTVSFNIKPLTYNKVLNNVVHLTLENDFGAYGDRNLGVWFCEDGSGCLVICAVVNGNASYCIETTPLILNKWSSVKIYQSMQGEKYWFSVDLNGVNIHRVENSDAKDFKNMKVYASDPWYNAQNGSITNLMIVNGKVDYIVNDIPTKIIKGKIFGVIPKLEKEFLISLDVFPYMFDLGWHNLIHFTIGSDNDRYGDRVPSISFFENGNLQIAASINGYNSWYFNLEPIGVNQWTNIEVSQIYKGSFYLYTIRINGNVIYSVNNNQSECFEDVKIYASDPWSEAQNGSIKSFFIINGISNSSIQPIVNFTKVMLFSQNSQDVSPSLSSVNNKLYIIIVAILAPVLFFLTISVVVVVLRIHRKKVKSLQSIWRPEIHKIENCIGFDLLPKDDWEIFPESISLENKIGEGAFGTVFVAKISVKDISKTGKANHKSFMFDIKEDSVINVAVKLLKDGANQSELDDFQEEISLMKGIGYHKNIVNMIGCSTIKKPLCLIVEFMENGDLLQFLRNKRSKLCTSKLNGESAVNFMYTQSYQQTLETTISENCTTECMPYEIPLDKIGLITPNDLISFAWQVAAGMEFLSCNKLVHRDLAARNILVGAEKNLKISDFGLTRRVNDELNYMSNKNRRLPIKWMSVEAIFDQIFTACSDVWSYGILLFEIVTLGGTPYPSINNRELLTLLKSGYRMDRPENCSEPMYDIMLHCWNEDPLQRPTFTELRERFDKIMSQGDSYLSFDIDEKNVYYNAASFNSLPAETDDVALEEDIFQKPVYIKSVEEIKKSTEEKLSSLNERYTNQLSTLCKELCN
nr:uncharacterized protein LOC100199204 [Hydra vulgaris]